MKLIAEIALMALIGRFVLGLMAGAKRHDNLIYQLLGFVTQPFEKLVRAISPRLVLDRHIPLAAGAFLLMVWFISLLFKAQICLEIGMDQCR
ncbi:hypothetical protein [Inhella sp.]|uniref:hypothetical protein n=1 Tax=Inhella sp. TaxID=1921806 RepID=UPI0035AFEB54